MTEMRITTMVSLLATALLWSALAAGPARAQEQAPRLAIEGYSPVSYFEEGHPEMGLPEFTAVYKDRTYRFTDADQLEKFEADPQAYAPLFPNHCPYNLALGRDAKIDPTNFKIAGDDLLLFHRSEEMDGLEKWNEHDDQEELKRRAESNYTVFEF